MIDYIVAQVCLISVFAAGFFTGRVFKPKVKQQTRTAINAEEQRRADQVKREILNMLTYDGTEQEDVTE